MLAARQAGLQLKRRLTSSITCVCVQLALWVNEKMLTAQDMTYDEARNLHSKWLKHQAFMAELQANKEWLEKIEKVWRMERRDGGMIGRGGMREGERGYEGR